MIPSNMVNRAVPTIYISWVNGAEESLDKSYRYLPFKPLQSPD